MHLLGPRKSLTTPTNGHWWLHDVEPLYIDWTQPAPTPWTQPAPTPWTQPAPSHFLQGEPLPNDITSLDPMGALFSDNPGWIGMWVWMSDWHQTRIKPFPVGKKTQENYICLWTFLHLSKLYGLILEIYSLQCGLTHLQSLYIAGIVPPGRQLPLEITVWQLFSKTPDRR